MNTERYKKYYQSGEGHFWLTNPNPRAKTTKRWDCGDCCIRALANAMSCSWLEAFDWLTVRARRDFSIVNDGRDFRRWLVEGGAVWKHLPAEAGKKRMKVREFAEAHPQGRFVICIAHHEVAVVEGQILDTWNCGERAIVGYFIMTDFKL